MGRANASEQKPAFPSQTRVCEATSKTAFEVTVIAKGLEKPWAVEPLPGGDFLVTEKTGQLRIVSANGKAIRSSRDMHNLVGLQRLGETIELKLFRDGLEETVPVTIQPIDIDKIDGGVIHPQLQGAVIGEMREQRLQRGRVDYLQILEVIKPSPAWEAGFRSGDIIYSINKQLTRNFDEAFDLAENAGRGMIMNIQRGNRELYILLK